MGRPAQIPVRLSPIISTQAGPLLDRHRNALRGRSEIPNRIRKGVAVVVEIGRRRRQNASRLQRGVPGGGKAVQEGNPHQLRRRPQKTLRKSTRAMLLGYNS